jgi:glycosyltransferase involved in cell wall biosynthesis
MSKYGRLWEGKFLEKDVGKYYKISFCTTCMGRLYNLKETLPKNIEDNKDYPHLEFVVLDYNSNDGLWQWMAENMMEHIESGLISYYRTIEPTHFSMAHSRNIAFKVANGEIVNNLDADNFTTNPDYSVNECWAFYLNRMANECGEKVIFSKGKRGMHGRIGFYKKEFIEILGGYDEDLLGYGHDDHDLVQRAWKQNFIMYWWGGQYISRIKTNRQEKNMNMEKHWKETENENKEKSRLNLEAGKFKANNGKHWGKATLIKNFHEKVEI